MKTIWEVCFGWGSLILMIIDYIWLLYQITPRYSTYVYSVYTTRMHVNVYLCKYIFFFTHFFWSVLVIFDMILCLVLRDPVGDRAPTWWKKWTMERRMSKGVLLNTDEGTIVMLFSWENHHSLPFFCIDLIHFDCEEMSPCSIVNCRDHCSVW